LGFLDSTGGQNYKNSKRTLHAPKTKNKMTVTNNSFYLGVYVGKKRIKIKLVKSIGVGKSTSVKVSIAKKYRNSLKTFKANCTNRIKEMNESNNSLKAR
jgi:hypothetical protein